MRRLNTKAQVESTKILQVDAGDGVELEIPLGQSSSALKSTGYRNIDSLFPNLTSGRTRIIRIGDVVYLTLDVCTFTSQGTSYLLWDKVLPTGWTPPLATPFIYGSLSVLASTSSNGAIRVSQTGSIALYGVLDKTASITLSWPTADAFPITLIGTPA